jgi:hypothetical protein
MVKAARNYFDGRKNLSPIKTHERAVELARRSVDARKLKAERKALLHDDIGETVTAEMDVPDSLYKPMKAYGLKVKKRERIDKVLFYRALLKAIKDGNADQLLKIAEFAGFRAENGELKIANAAGGKVTVNILRMAGHE